MKINNFYIKNKYHSTLSTDSAGGTTADVVPNTYDVGVKSVADAYLSLIIEFVAYFKLTDHDGHLIKILFNVDDLTKIHENSIPFIIKKFCSNVRVASNSPFGRNLLEILLLPISRNIVINNDAIRFSRANPTNDLYYKELMFNNDVREACIKYMDQLSDLEEITITPRTTLSSFKRKALVQKLLGRLGSNTLTQQERYLLVGLFLDSILFEVIRNDQNKHSKAIIPNFIINVISKSAA